MYAFHLTAILANLLITAAAPDPADVEKRALARYRTIRSGEVEVSSTMITEGSGKKVHTAHVWLNGDDIRSDTFFPAAPGERWYNEPGSLPDSRPEGYRELRCDAGADHFFFPQVPLSDGKEMAFTIRGSGDSAISLFEKICDPRLIGFVNWNFANLAGQKVDSFFGRGGRKSVVVSPATHNGVECWQIDYEFESGVKSIARIAPQMDYAVLYMESRVGKDWQSLDTEYDGSLGVWFPIRSRFVRTENGGNIEREERLELKIISLNRDIDPSVFQVAGMGVPAGTPILDARRPARDGPFYWDGKSIVNANPSAAPPIREGGGSAPWAVVSMSLAVIGVALALWSLKHWQTGRA